jgi:hypothetical protein
MKQDQIFAKALIYYLYKKLATSANAILSLNSVTYFSKPVIHKIVMRKLLLCIL